MKKCFSFQECYFHCWGQGWEGEKGRSIWINIDRNESSWPSWWVSYWYIVHFHSRSIVSSMWYHLRFLCSDPLQRTLCSIRLGGSAEKLHLGVLSGAQSMEMLSYMDVFCHTQKTCPNFSGHTANVLAQSNQLRRCVVTTQKTGSHQRRVFLHWTRNLHLRRSRVSTLIQVGRT